MKNKINELVVKMTNFIIRIYFYILYNQNIFNQLDE